MAKHNLEVEPEEGYELVQVISEDRGKNRDCTFKLCLINVFFPSGVLVKTCANVL